MMPAALFGQHAGAQRRAAVLLAVTMAFAFACLCVAIPQQAHAASGTVYSCEVVPSYKHPVTGEVADAGGKSAQATGQAMVESCLSKKGMFEQTDAGACYLTLRLGLIDYTSGHDFRVQEWGASSWSKPKMGVTAKGSDKNGTTNDVCIQVPAKKSIVKVSMFVESMGRDVVFFCYPANLKKGQPKGFEATRVTAASAGSSSAKADEAATEPEGGAAQDGSQGSASSGKAEAGGQGAANLPDVSATDAGASASASESSDAGNASSGEGASELADGQMSEAQGLSLSTAGDASAGAQGGQDAEAGSVGALAAGSGSATAGGVLLGILVATAPGLILLLVASLIVYVFVRNWNRWRGTDPDDYSSAYEDEPW